MHEQPLLNSPVLSDPMLLGKRADELSLLIERQIGPVFERLGIQIPVRSCSLMLFLHENGDTSAADLAKALGYSHQLVLQKIPLLIRRRLLRRRNDPEDRRRRLFILTAEGRRQVELLTQHSETIRRIYEELYAEIGVDLFTTLSRALDALSQRDLSTRMQDLEPGDVPPPSTSIP